MLDRNRLASHLQAFPKTTIPVGSLRPAAVLVPLYQRDGRDYLLFTERTAHLEHHAGEISFPGGGYDAGDADLSMTALRETEEEIGVLRNSVKVIGQLSQLYIPPSNFNVQPVIAYTNNIPDFILEENEVDSVLEIDIEDFVNKQNIQHKKVLTRNNLRVSVICYFIQNEIIWGASAMIISEFVEVLKKINLKS